MQKSALCVREREREPESSHQKVTVNPFNFAERTEKVAKPQRSQPPLSRSRSLLVYIVRTASNFVRCEGEAAYKKAFNEV
jgi:hypothetical protein